MYCTESPQGQRQVFWDWGKGSYLHELSILIMQPKGLTPIQGIVACNNGVSQKQTKTIAKGDLEMLKCAAVHPRVSSPCRCRPWAALPSLHQPGCWGFPVLWWQPCGTEHSPFQPVAWVVLQLSAAALRFSLRVGPPEPLLLISEEKRLLMEHLQLPGDSAAYVWKKTLYWAACQRLLGEMLLAGPLERENSISSKMCGRRKQKC